MKVLCDLLEHFMPSSIVNPKWTSVSGTSRFIDCQLVVLPVDWGFYFYFYQRCFICWVERVSYFPWVRIDWILTKDLFWNNLRIVTRNYPSLAIRVFSLIKPFGKFSFWKIDDWLIMSDRSRIWKHVRNSFPAKCKPSSQRQFLPGIDRGFVSPLPFLGWELILYIQSVIYYEL